MSSEGTTSAVKPTRSRARRRAVAAGVIALSAVTFLAACSAAPTSGSGASGTTTSYLPCVLGDVGGFTDHSFNELALDGVIAASKKIGSSYKKVQAPTANNYSSSLKTLVSQGCDLIAAPGFTFVGAVKASAKANPKTDFAMIDDNSIKASNVKSIVFETDEAAFLGGYVAASYSKTGVVATWGGAQYPSVSIYMDGVYDGIKYYNEQKGKNVKLLGWDETTQKGTFLGNFTDQNAAKTTTQNFLDQQADVIIPVAGNLYEGAAAAITGTGSSAVLVGVDTDIVQTDPKYKSLMLVSILKGVEAATQTVTEEDSKAKSFDNSTYIGTLANSGVGLSSFHDYASKVSPSLSKELKTIKAGIIDGSIKVASPSSFTK